MRFVALFLALAGTALAGAPLLTSRDVADRTITSADVRDGTLPASALANGERLPRGPRGPAGATGPPGPTGFAPPGSYQFAAGVKGVHVGADGAVRRPGPDVGVRHPSRGEYCVTLPAHEWVDVTSTSLGSAQRVAVTDPSSVPGCATRVTVAPAGGALDDGPFLLVYREAR